MNFLTDMQTRNATQKIVTEEKGQKIRDTDGEKAFGGVTNGKILSKN